MTDATGDAEPTTEAEEQPFENRAARRAKGKKAAAQAVSATGHVHGRSGTVQSPRQYGNRRSG
ncbi:hypothetical protein [Actinoplanes sp. HUAS TT8]|uniref:hypothetical protein n=1 Tax=Actinoplanes sp. HUAS TT8 TaxID=3447453 RepID=UPI003F528CAF